MSGRAGAGVSKPLTETELLLLVQKRYPEPAYAFLRHVAQATGGYPGRTADAVVMSTWPSRGLELMGFEVKSYRSDWLRELRNPAKADGLVKYMDRWWVVAADRGVVLPGELPPTWGLLVPRGSSGLAAAVEAPRLDATPINRSFLAAILRNASRRTLDSPEVALLVAQAREEGLAEGKRLSKYADQGRDDALAHLQRSVAAFEARSGISITDYNGERIGEAVRWLADWQGGGRLRSAIASAKRLAADLDAAIASAESSGLADFTARPDGE